MSRDSLVAGLGCLLLLSAPAAGWEAAPHGAPTSLKVRSGQRSAGIQLAQEKGIHGQDAMSGRGAGPTGWVQAPVPRGHDAPEQAAQGAGAAPGGASAGAGTNAAQPPAGQNPGTPIATPLPGPSGIAPAVPGKQP